MPVSSGTLSFGDFKAGETVPRRPPPPPRDALEGKGPRRRLEEVAEAVGGGYCRLQMPLRLALGVKGDSGWA